MQWLRLSQPSLKCALLHVTKILVPTTHPYAATSLQLKPTCFRLALETHKPLALHDIRASGNFTRIIM